MSSKQASDFKYYLDYSRYREDLQRKETWDESVDRIMDMHRFKYKDKMSAELEELINFAEGHYKQKNVLGSMRALQFGGSPILKHNSKLYNCLTSYCDRPNFFNEAMYWLLSGCGVGFSVQFHHVSRLPKIRERNLGVITFVIPDSIEGWSDAIKALMYSYFDNENEYSGYRIDFDYSLIRQKGAYISGGYKAPGPDGLRKSITKIQELLDSKIKHGFKKLTPIVCYDIVMHCSDAVLSGGIRRAATLCLFSHNDEEMINAKTGNWFVTNPQRARSNNSAALVKSEITKEEYDNIYSKVKEFGEPAFIFVENGDIVFNPCVEIGMTPYLLLNNGEKVSGWQGCNLTTINGKKCNTPELFFEYCKASAILGTLQAGYTSFPYVGEVTEQIFEREALLGCSVTGWMNNPEVLFDIEVQRTGAEIIKYWNKILSELIGINQAARSTCVKPEGNASVLLECSSGIHGEHAPLYFRNMQVNKEADIAKIFLEMNPEAVEESVWSSTNTDYVVSFPIKAKKDSIFKQQLLGIKQLEYVKLTQQNWVECGTNIDLCVDKATRHNVSNTISVDNWEDVQEYLWNNKKYFAGVSLLGVSGDKDYAQAPFTQVFSAEDLLLMYGDCALLASGLIVDGLHAFGDDLWKACNVVLGIGEDISSDSYNNALKRDWVRRVNTFAERYLDDDVLTTTYCLKDVYNFHKWITLEREMIDINFSELDTSPSYTEVDTLGAVACSGGVCEII